MAYGTDLQSKYLVGLAARLGYAQVSQALADLTQFGPATKLSVDEASDAITQLKACAGDSDPPAAAPARQRFFTARHLRQISEGQRTAPEQLDEDAAWVIDRLQRLGRVLEACGAATAAPAVPQSIGVNEGRPIEMEQLLRYYKTWDALAEAFKVAVTTVKAWGTHLPPGRAFEAEIRTEGYVRAPRG